MLPKRLIITVCAAGKGNKCAMLHGLECFFSLVCLVPTHYGLCTSEPLLNLSLTKNSLSKGEFFTFPEHRAPVSLQVALTVMASRLRRLSRSSAVCSPAGPQEQHNGPRSLWESGAPGSLRVNGKKPATGAAVRYRSCVYTHPCWHTPRREKKMELMDKNNNHAKQQREFLLFLLRFLSRAVLSVPVFVKERIRIHSSVLLTYTYLLECSSLCSIRLLILSHYYKPGVYAAVQYHSADAKVLVTQITALHSLITVMGQEGCILRAVSGVFRHVQRYWNNSAKTSHQTPKIILYTDDAIMVVRLRSAFQPWWPFSCGLDVFLEINFTGVFLSQSGFWLVLLHLQYDRGFMYISNFY